MPIHRRTFPGEPRELRTARNWTRAKLDGHPHSEDAALIVTELGTNALSHTASGDAAGTFHVVLTVSELTVVIAVTDSGTAQTAPGIRHPSPDDVHGRGLAMVTALADTVAVRGGDNGRTVTAELHVPAALQEPAPQHTRSGDLQC